jgi:queuine tRNA-ribosyltransferase
VGFGGWPVDAEGRLLVDAFDVLLSLVPRELPVFALGVGKPEHLVALCARRPGFVFDCTLPTRDARSHRLYVFEPGWPEAPLPGDDSFYSYVYILDDRQARADAPVEAGCDCECCTRYGRAYLHHLFKVKDPQAERLASIHNLRFYTRLVARLAP